MNVLICDDHELFSEALGDVLLDRGHTVVLTSSPDQAVAAARRDPPDVCVMDRTFRGRDLGISAVRDVLHASPGTMVMVLTGDADAAGARSAVAAGARGFLTKDEALETVVEGLEQLAAGMLVVDVHVLRPDVRAKGSPLLGALTSRELEVLHRLVNGQSGQAMAAEMQIAHSTMRTHVQNLLVKLGVHSQLEAAAYAVQHSLVQSQVS